ncbi:MAG: hypothetical protein CMIDDMOC_00505 [Sodalis sp. Fle]|nr:MAG: hypothetical protein CMIDDMOC_00505 [Sodalis sp. Fle]
MALLNLIEQIVHHVNANWLALTGQSSKKLHLSFLNKLDYARSGITEIVTAG